MARKNHQAKLQEFLKRYHGVFAVRRLCESQGCLLLIWVAKIRGKVVAILSCATIGRPSLLRSLR